MSILLKPLLRGAATVVPLVVTGYILYWLLYSAEQIFKSVIFLISDRWYFPGLGIFAGLMVTFLIGLLMEASLLRKLFLYFERRILSIPIVKTIYGAFRDFFDFFGGEKTDEFSKVVLITIPNSGKKMLGFVTSRNPEKSITSLEESMVAVYLPMSYQLGGYTIYVSTKEIEEVDMTIEEATRFALTAGVAKT